MPLVKCSSAGSSGSVGAISQPGGGRQQRAQVLAPGHAPIVVGSPDEQHVLEARQLSRTARPCAVEPGVVTSTRAVAERSRSRMGSGPKAENSGEKTPPGA